MGDAASRLRWRRLHGLSSQVKDSTHGRLINQHQINRRAAFWAAFCYARRLPGLADRVAKVPKCAATNFPPRTKQATIGDRCALNRVTEIACEFIASRRSPSHDYLIVAPTARRNHVQ
jgi:hypothetical protein